MTFSTIGMTFLSGFDSENKPITEERPLAPPMCYYQGRVQERDGTAFGLIAADTCHQAGVEAMIKLSIEDIAAAHLDEKRELKSSNSLNPKRRESHIFTLSPVKKTKSTSEGVSAVDASKHVLRLLTDRQLGTFINNVHDFIHGGGYPRNRVGKAQTAEERELSMYGDEWNPIYANRVKKDTFNKVEFFSEQERRELTPSRSTKKYVEVVIVNDKSRLDTFTGDGGTIETMAAQSVTVMNAVNAIYNTEDGSNGFTVGGTPYDVFIVAYAMHTFVNGDDYADTLVMSSSNAAETMSDSLLDRFNAWAQEAVDGGVLVAHDNHILLSGKDFEGNTVGLAYVSRMCAGEKSGNINMCKMSDSTAFCAAVVFRYVMKFAITVKLFHGYEAQLVDHSKEIDWKCPY